MRKERVITTVGWILAVAAAWVVVALVVGLVLGRVIRVRERQRPSSPVRGVPGQRPAPAADGYRADSAADPAQGRDPGRDQGTPRGPSSARR